MTTATVETPAAPVAPVDKQLYNKNKIAEAEALAAEALKMANEAKLAAARLAEVKKTLSMFSSKLEKAEQSVQKDITIETVKPAVVEDELKADPPSPKDAAEVPEPTPAPVVEEPAPVAPVAKAPVAPAPIEEPYKSDIVEDFFDGIGVGKMCGVDDETLGLTDRAATKPAPVEPFVNPTRIAVKELSAEDMLREVSSQEAEAAQIRKERGLPSVQYQRQLINEDFNDPFGVDHDDLVMCGKIADVCEPPVIDDAVYEENDIAL